MFYILFFYPHSSFKKMFQDAIKSQILEECSYFLRNLSTTLKAFVSGLGKHVWSVIVRYIWQ